MMDGFLKEMAGFRSDFRELLDAKVDHILGMIADMQQQLQAQEWTKGKEIIYDGFVAEIQSKQQMVIPITDFDEFECGENNQIENRQGISEMPHPIPLPDLMHEHHNTTVDEADFLIGETTKMQAQKVFDEVPGSEFEVVDIPEMVQTKLEIGIEENGVNEELIEGEHDWIVQDLGQHISVIRSSRDQSTVFDVLKVSDKMLLQEFEVSVKKRGIRCFGSCLVGFKSEIGADFMLLRPSPKPPPTLDFYIRNSVVLKRREESVNMKTLIFVSSVKIEKGQSKMLSVLQVHLSTIIPIDACSLTSYLLPRHDDKSLISDYIVEFNVINCHVLRFKCCCIRSEKRVEVCTVHLREQGTLTGHGSVKAKLYIVESNHCSLKCYLDAWQHHSILHECVASDLSEYGTEEDEMEGKTYFCVSAQFLKKQIILMDAIELSKFSTSGSNPSIVDCTVFLKKIVFSKKLDMDLFLKVLEIFKASRIALIDNFLEVVVKSLARVGKQNHLPSVGRIYHTGVLSFMEPNAISGAIVAQVFEKKSDKTITCLDPEEITLVLLIFTKGLAYGPPKLVVDRFLELDGIDARNQADVDAVMLNIDETSNKSKLGADSMLGVSLSRCRAGAREKGVPLYKHIQEASNAYDLVMPVPTFNFINGGSHVGNKLAMQEFMIMPVGASSFSEAFRIGSGVYRTLKEIINAKYGQDGRNVRDDSGFAPNMQDNREGLVLLMDAIEKAGYTSKFKKGMKVAASKFLSEEGKYDLNFKKQSNDDTHVLTAAYLCDLYREFVGGFPIVSIGEPLDQDEYWSSWSSLQSSADIQIVGGDWLITNPKNISEAIRRKALQSHGCAKLRKHLEVIKAVVKTVGCLWLDTMLDWPLSKPPPQFRHLSRGDTTL